MNTSNILYSACSANSDQKAPNLLCSENPIYAKCFRMFCAVEIAAFSLFKLLRFCKWYLCWTWNNLASASTDKMAFCASIGKGIFPAKFASKIFAAFSIKFELCLALTWFLQDNFWLFCSSAIKFVLLTWLPRKAQGQRFICSGIRSGYYLIPVKRRQVPMTRAFESC